MTNPKPPELPKTIWIEEGCSTFQKRDHTEDFGKPYYAYDLRPTEREMTGEIEGLDDALRLTAHILVGETADTIYKEQYQKIVEAARRYAAMSKADAELPKLIKIRTGTCACEMKGKSTHQDYCEYGLKNQPIPDHELKPDYEPSAPVYDEAGEEAKGKASESLAGFVTPPSVGKALEDIISSVSLLEIQKPDENGDVKIAKRWLEMFCHTLRQALRTEREGYVMVPREPTQEMMAAFWSTSSGDESCDPLDVFGWAYRAMIAAATKAD